MKAITILLTSLVSLVNLAPSQSGAQLKQELKAKEAAAKQNPDALFEAGKWAAEKSMPSEAKRIYQAVLKVKADHEGANIALGNELIEGKWLPAKEAEALRKKAQAAEFTAKGFVDVGGVWVDKTEVEDAKKGIFHHEGDLVTKEEKVALMSGRVRHPVTGEFLDARQLEQASKRYFPVANNRLADEKEADTFHSDFKRPWVLRSKRATLISTLPIAKLEALAAEADLAVEDVEPILGTPVVHPKHRAVVLVATTDTEYRDFGARFGDENSSHGACLIQPKAVIQVPFLGDVRAAMCRNEKNWGIRYVRHATAMSYVHGVCVEADEDLPLWLLHGIAACTSRLKTGEDRAHFGRLHIAKGGVRNLKGFFAGFGINGEMESTAVDGIIFQAGLVVYYAKEANDPKVAEVLKEVFAALKSGGAKKGALQKVVARLEAALIEAEPNIADYLKKLTSTG